jgi:hypothetical protein
MVNFECENDQEYHGIPRNGCHFRIKFRLPGNVEKSHRLCYNTALYLEQSVLESENLCVRNGPGVEDPGKFFKANVLFKI